MLEQMAGKEPSAVPEPYRPIIRWTANSLMANTSVCYPPGRKHSASRSTGWARCCFAMRRLETKMSA